MTLFGCDNSLNIASTNYVDCVVTTVSGHLQDQISSRIIDRAFQVTSVVNSTAETVLASGVLPANSFNELGGARFTFLGSFTNNTGSTSHTSFIRFKLNGTTAMAGFQAEVSAGGPTWRLQTTLIANGAVSGADSVFVDGFLLIGDNSPQQSHDDDIGVYSTDTAAVKLDIDFTQDVTWQITAEQSTASSNFKTEFRAYYIERL